MRHLTFGICISYKKNLWLFFSKYGFIRKIKPFHLRMKHNITQMTATAGLTVPHSINQIFQYIFDYLGKWSVRSTSIFVASGAQKIQTRKSTRKAHAPITSDCLERILVRWHHWAIFLLKWAWSRGYGQWRALPCHSQQIFVSKNWRGWHGPHLVSTRQGHLPHS